MNIVVHEEPVGSSRTRCSNKPLLARVKEDCIAAAVRIEASSSNRVLMMLLLSRFQDLLDGIVLLLLRERTQQGRCSQGTCQPLTTSTNLSDNRTLRKQLLRVVRVQLLVSEQTMHVILLLH